MKTFKIYFNDLNEKAQKDLLVFVGVEDPKEMNWDLDIVPIATFDYEEQEYSEFITMKENNDDPV